MPRNQDTLLEDQQHTTLVYSEDPDSPITAPIAPTGEPSAGSICCRFCGVTLVVNNTTSMMTQSLYDLPAVREQLRDHLMAAHAEWSIRFAVRAGHLLTLLMSTSDPALASTFAIRDEIGGLRQKFCIDEVKIAAEARVTSWRRPRQGKPRHQAKAHPSMPKAEK
jgi:hypothetical protein